MSEQDFNKRLNEKEISETLAAELLISTVLNDIELRSDINKHTKKVMAKRLEEAQNILENVHSFLKMKSN